MSVINTIVCESVQQAADLLNAGQLVAFPTETVYGLGADARNPESVAGIFESKQRPSFDPLIVHVRNIDHAAEFTVEMPQIAKELANNFWPGPLTMVLPRNRKIPDLVTSGLPGVGLRVPAHSTAQKLLSLTDGPLAAPSANPFGGISPTTAQHVLDGLSGRIHGVLDGGACDVGVESTVISLMEDRPMILRHGGTSVEDIESAIGTVEIAKSDPSRDDAAQPSPGMLSRHYAPRTQLQLFHFTNQVEPVRGLRTGLLTHGECLYSGGFAHIERLGPTDDTKTCAAKLFASMRTLDSLGLDVIIAHTFPTHGLGRALNDRLTRAAT